MKLSQLKKGDKFRFVNGEKLYYLLKNGNYYEFIADENSSSVYEVIATTDNTVICTVNNNTIVFAFLGTDIHGTEAKDCNVEIIT